MKIAFYFLTIIFFLTSCSYTALLPTGGTIIEEGSACYKFSSAYNEYRITNLGYKKYLAEGVYPKGWKIKYKQKMEECILEKSQNLCKEDHYTKAVDLKWSEKKSNDEKIFTVLALDFKCDLTQEKIKKEKKNVKPFEDLYESSCLSEKEKMKKNRQTEYLIGNPSYQTYKDCLLNEDSKIAKKISLVLIDFKHDLEKSFFSITKKCGDEERYLPKGSSFWNQATNPNYLICLEEEYKLRLNEQKIRRKDEINNIKEEYPLAEKHCENEDNFFSIRGNYFCYKIIPKIEQSISNLEKEFFVSKFKCKLYNFFTSDRYNKYYTCLESLEYEQEIKENKKIAAQRLKDLKTKQEKDEKRRAEEELAKLEPYKKKCEGYGFKRDTTEMGMCILTVKNSETHIKILERQIANARVRELELKKDIQELQIAYNSILDDANKQRLILSRNQLLAEIQSSQNEIRKIRQVQHYQGLSRMMNTLGLN